MKRFLCTLLVVLMAAAMLPTRCYAAETSVTYFEDGSYLVEEIRETGSRASGTKSGSKTSSHYGDDGTLNWKAVLTGTFSYTGTSATCTSSSVSVTIYDSDWYTISKSAGKSGSSATASVSMGRKALGVTVDQKDITIKLTCSANGSLS